MDSVTESRTAITMAREGGIGILHKNLPIEAQAREVERVKRAESGMILGPVTARPSQSLRAALEVMREHDISGVPVVEGERPVGILTARDIRFEQNLDQPVSALMTRELVTVPPGVSVDEAKRLLHKHRIEKLLVVDGDGKLVGLITIKDILQADKYPQAVKDEQRRLRVGAAIGPGPDRHERTAALVAAGVDVIVVDTAHGHSRGVLEAVRATKKEFSGVRVIAGNVATAEATEALIDAGVDAREGRHRPRQHLHHARRRRRRRAADHRRERLRARRRPPRRPDHRRRRREALGRRHEGHRRRREQRHDRLALRGHRRVAGRPRALPGPQLQGVPRHGQPRRHEEGQPRPLRPGGHRRREARARRASRGACRTADRSRRSSTSWSAGCAAAWATRAARPSHELRTKARFVRITSQGLRESHVHDVIITEEAPNYFRS